MRVARRLLSRATLSSFLLEFESKGFGFFDAAVQLFEQGRHLAWDLRSHRALARYRMALSAAVQNKTTPCSCSVRVWDAERLEQMQRQGIRTTWRP